jgi:hypothetical protein
MYNTELMSDFLNQLKVQNWNRESFLLMISSWVAQRELENRKLFWGSEIEQNFFIFFSIISTFFLSFLISTALQRKCENIKLRCGSRFQRVLTACCVFKVITLIGSNQGNYFENATACSKRTLKTAVAT